MGREIALMKKSFFKNITMWFDRRFLITHKLNSYLFYFNLAILSCVLFINISGLLLNFDLVYFDNNDSNQNNDPNGGGTDPNGGGADPNGGGNGPNQGGNDPNGGGNDPNQGNNNNQGNSNNQGNNDNQGNNNNQDNNDNQENNRQGNNNNEGHPYNPNLAHNSFSVPGDDPGACEHRTSQRLIIADGPENEGKQIPCTFCGNIALNNIPFQYAVGCHGCGSTICEGCNAPNADSDNDSGVSDTE